MIKFEGVGGVRRPEGPHLAAAEALRQPGIRNSRKSRNRITEPIRKEILKGFPPSEALGDVI